MNPTKIDLVRASFERVSRNPSGFSTVFYQRLFEIDPDTKKLFKGDMEEQGNKLAQTLEFVIENLDHIDDIVPIIEELGRRHVTYGVEERHYNSVGQALLWALADLSRNDFTEETLEAWVEVYGNLSWIMKNASKVNRPGFVGD